MDSPAEKIFLQKLRSFGYSDTAARRAVFRTVLDSRHRLLSIQDIVATLNGDVNRASVYRNITVLEKCGLIHKVFSGWKYRFELSDDFSDHHHHLTCVRCGIVRKIPSLENVENLLIDTARGFGFRLSGHQLELSGICEACQKLGTPGTPEVLGKPHTST